MGSRIGIVKFFNQAEGFGFITALDSGQEIYVNQRHISQSINNGQRVVFDVAQSTTGIEAVNVAVTHS